MSRQILNAEPQRNKMVSRSSSQRERGYKFERAHGRPLVNLLTTKSYGKDIFPPLLNELVRLERIQTLAECEAPRATPKQGAWV